ncbi:MAG: hypothetical protein UY48_C0001G0047 [Candidatus Gottesmanbacteria bacterium GW2011_GWB1_49_7]|uniref:Uncharacterized protein n=1 Tax=Candidatus Gottesmanbacteria bacterium GW2011_GWB1_49_7 TaxID=1618448 RepID=A0A0G1W3S6_9BACT|nr:MAG: hypothetical protein UY48_C0001G0047 [Candidatus Gottesmanbacteria bacterium GW2011_GWB1_49_7]
MSLPYAEEINYWKTGQSSPDIWISKARELIIEFGGRILMEAFGQDETGKSAFVLAFEIGEDRFKIIWPVLPSKTKNEKAARIQAATMLHHDVKAKCVSAAVIGARTAFFSYLMLPDGRIAAQLSAPEITDAAPSFFLLLPEGQSS